LLLSNVERLIRIHKNIGQLQVLYAGKAHPSDKIGQKLIQDIVNTGKKYRQDIKILFLEGYDLDLGKLMTSGVDVWLNTPLPPNEASGTSGMKAAHNGIPHFSTLDGWWLEGHIENETGWAIGGERPAGEAAELAKGDAEELYKKLEEKIVPLYYKNKETWKDIMRNAIAINASFFNTHRMVQHYVQEAYFYHED
ncbi:alpha-glucan family phosphorylase, partial [Patescibacteria group bacterium]|nr:alpha-glucan family phosphorylase [Patescibacteria group bacterium]